MDDGTFLSLSESLTDGQSAICMRYRGRYLIAMLRSLRAVPNQYHKKTTKKHLTQEIRSLRLCSHDVTKSGQDN